MPLSNLVDAIAAQITAAVENPPAVSSAPVRSDLHVAASVDELLRLVAEEVGRREHGVTAS